ncbi:PKD domain-containing protein, partial [Nocardioides hankookensis]
ATPTWTTPVSELAVFASGAGVWRQVVGPDGTAWTSSWGGNGSHQLAVVSRRSPGADWDPPVTLSAADVDGRAPELAVDAGGTAYAVWDQGWPSSTWFAQSTPDGGWTPPLQLAEDGVYSTITAGADGALTVAWKDSAYRLHTIDRPAGSATWTDPVQLSPDGWASESPLLRVDGHGGVVALWRQISPIGAGIFMVEGAYRAAGGAWSTPTHVSDPLPLEAANPDLVITPDGTAVAGWRQDVVVDGATRSRVQTATSVLGGAWTDPSDLSDLATDARAVDLASDAEGVVTAAWTENAAGSYAIRTARLTGSGWTQAVTIGTSPGSAYGPADGVALDVAPDGRVAAIWVAEDETFSMSTMGATADASGSWTEPVTLDADASSTNPVITMSPDGDAVASWAGVTTSYVVRSAVLDGTGPVLSGLAAPSTAETGDTLDFAVDVADTWSDLGEVTWDFGDGATAVGPSVSHAFAAAGSYPVQVVATDV